MGCAHDMLEKVFIFRQFAFNSSKCDSGHTYMHTYTYTYTIHTRHRYGCFKKVFFPPEKMSFRMHSSEMKLSWSGFWTTQVSLCGWCWWDVSNRNSQSCDAQTHTYLHSYTPTLLELFNNWFNEKAFCFGYFSRNDFSWNMERMGKGVERWCRISTSIIIKWSINRRVKEWSIKLRCICVASEEKTEWFLNRLHYLNPYYVSANHSHW